MRITGGTTPTYTTADFALDLSDIDAAIASDDGERHLAARREIDRMMKSAFVSADWRFQVQKRSQLLNDKIRVAVITAE